MIFGIGTDLIEIARLEKALARGGERFAEKILGPQEWELYLRRQEKSPARGLRFLATRFAAKEAFAKALGLGMRTPMSWHAMQTLNDDLGKPIVLTSGALAAFMQHQGLIAQISLSDQDRYVLAFVIIEKSHEKN